MKKYIANVITFFRIICCVFMLFVPVLSMQFYVFYILCGLSDMVDGTVARKTGSASVFGAKLDTAADTLFTAVSFTKLFSVIALPKWLGIWIIAIAAIKVCNIIAGFVSRKAIIALHTMMNKATGLLLFLFPLTVHFSSITCSATTVCIFATYAAVQEGYYIWTGQQIC